MTAISKVTECHQMHSLQHIKLLISKFHQLMSCRYSAFYAERHTDKLLLFARR